MSQVDQFVRYAEKIANGPYRYGSFDCSDRCNPEKSGCADCSGLVCASLRAAGANPGCLGSFALAIVCHQHGAGISIAQARATRGALVFLGKNEGQGGIPGVDEGHVAISRGDGTTVEARNHAAGILYGPFDGRGWVYAALPTPWISVWATPPAPAPQPEEDEMQKFLFVDEIHPGLDANHPKEVTVQSDGTLILANGAAIHDRPAVAFNHFQVVRSELVSGWDFQGAAPVKNAEGKTEGVRYAATDPDGGWHPYVYYFA